MILDADGNERMRLATDGITMEGLLKILAGGEFHFEDGDGVRRVRISGRADGGEANVSYRSSDDSSGEVSFGALFDSETGELVGHGIAVQQDTGTDVFKARSLDGTSLIDCQYFGRGLAMQIDNDVLVRPVGGDVLLRITEADGIRIAVDTDGARNQSGQVTAGPADSAGTGFRTLRIPN